MEKAGKTMWSALRRVAQPERPLDLLIAVWPLMVGQRMASHTRPVAWNKGRVVVEVSEAEWQRQLEGLSRDIRRQINHWWGAQLVREVRFLLSEKPRASARPGRGGAPSVGDHTSTSSDLAVAENKLSSALKELEPALSGIADHELRDLIARVAAQYLAKQEKK